MAMAFGEWSRQNPGGTRQEYEDYMSLLVQAAERANAGSGPGPAAVIAAALDGYDEMAYTAGMVADVLEGLRSAGYAIVPARPGTALLYTQAELDAAVTEAEDISGEDVVAGAGPDATCGCGYGITYYEGEWLHILNPELTGADDHDAEPDDPGDVDWGDYAVTEAEDSKEGEASSG